MDLQTLEVADIIQIHEHLVLDFAATSDPISPSGVKSTNLLESAVSRQHTSMGERLKYPQHIDNAATLAYGICCNHAFHNGNKRTAVVAMLVHLDRNKHSLFNIGQKELYEMIMGVATHTIGEERRHPRQERNSDFEVHEISRWIAKSASKIIRGERPITYRQLQGILKGFSFSLENPKGNSIDIVRYEEVTKGLFKKRTISQRVHLTSIPYPGDGREVPVNVLKLVRTRCALTEADGVDSRSFYDQNVVLDSFINHYRNILKRLARS